MRSSCRLAAALLAAAATRLAAQVDTFLARNRELLPAPRAVAWQAGALDLDSTLTVATLGPRDPRLERAVLRALSRLEATLGQPLDRTIRRAGPARLVVRIGAPGMTVQGPGEDESYSLTVTADGAVLDAATTVGALRGLETFLQLVESPSPGKRPDGRASLGWYVPSVVIRDAPRFAWRGLLLDVARHFMPPDVVRRTLDGMAAVKLNVLHWHLSDDQGFRVESRRFPRLQQLGSDGLYYTQRQIRDLVAYARDRGIRVVPEFDMPGHTASWFVGYPQYASLPGPYARVREFGVFDPVFDPTRESVYRFLDAFVAEMAPLFPDAYWHVGGDEVNGVQWAASPRIQAFMRSHHLAGAPALQTWFNRRLRRILARHHKRMVGWDEILAPDLPADAVIQSWRGTQYLDSAVVRGHGAILSAPYYLDHMSSAEDLYRADPLPAGTALSAGEQARVLGGEACMWAEHVDSLTVDSRLWPRLAAVAERLWSPPGAADVADMYRRLGATSARLDVLGVLHRWQPQRAALRFDAVTAGLLPDLQPATFGRRSQVQRTTQRTPLSNVVDAAIPDPPVRYELVRHARALAASPSDSLERRAVLRILDGARQAARGVERAAGDPDQSPYLAQVVPAAWAVDSAGALGAEAVAYLSRGERASAAWTRDALAATQRWAEPPGLLRPAITDAVLILVRAAGGTSESPR